MHTVGGIEYSTDIGIVWSGSKTYLGTPHVASYDHAARRHTYRYLTVWRECARIVERWRRHGNFMGSTAWAARLRGLSTLS